ncbi:hypothetical protein GCM10027341_37860 [Spirosoma knui]
MTAPALVILHRGDPYYLKYCLYQARHTNPDSTIYLIGDESNGHYKGIHHHLTSTYWTSAAEFTDAYVHLSSRGYEYELFCIQRWFVLLDFMRAHQLERCVHLDSDVLLYDNLHRTGDWLGHDILQYIHWIPHVMYINSLYALEQWCSYVTQSYEDSARLQVLQALYQQYTDGQDPGFIGVSDMTLLELYQKQYDERTSNLFKRREFTDAVHDDNLNTGSRFNTSSSGLGKQLVWRRGVPYGYFEGKFLRFQSLHCQGYAKARMPVLSTFPKNSMQTAYWKDALTVSWPYIAKTWYRALRYGSGTARNQAATQQVEHPPEEPLTAYTQ